MNKPQTHTPLRRRKCEACKGDLQPLEENEIRDYLKELNGWHYEAGALQKFFEFSDYYETVSFINAIAWICHTENHHPDISFGYKTCTVRLKTHVIQAVSENDMIVAAKIDGLSDADDL